MWAVLPRSLTARGTSPARRRSPGAGWWKAPGRRPTTAKPAASQVAMARALVETTKLYCIARKPAARAVSSEWASIARATPRPCAAGGRGIAGVRDVGAVALLVRAQVVGAEGRAALLGEEDAGPRHAPAPVAEGAGAPALGRRAEDLAGGADRLEDGGDGVLVVGKGRADAHGSLSARAGARLSRALETAGVRPAQTKRSPQTAGRAAIRKRCGGQSAGQADRQ